MHPEILCVVQFLHPILLLCRPLPIAVSVVGDTIISMDPLASDGTSIGGSIRTPFSRSLDPQTRRNIFGAVGAACVNCIGDRRTSGESLSGNDI